MLGGFWSRRRTSSQRLARVAKPSYDLRALQSRAPSLPLQRSEDQHVKVCSPDRQRRSMKFDYNTVTLPLSQCLPVCDVCNAPEHPNGTGFKLQLSGPEGAALADAPVPCSGLTASGPGLPRHTPGLLHHSALLEFALDRASQGSRLRSRPDPIQAPWIGEPSSPPGPTPTLERPFSSWSQQHQEWLKNRSPQS